MSEAQAAMRDWRYGVGKLLYASPGYRLTLIGSTPAGLNLVPPDPWPGNAARGVAIIRGELRFFGESVSGSRHVWQPDGMRPDWLAELHSFDWLRDLRAVGGDAARRRARELVGDWLARQANWDETAWRPDVLARRLFAWLGQHDFFCASAPDGYRKLYLAGLNRQSRHLHRVLPGGVDGVPLITAIKGLIVAGLALPSREGWSAQGLKLLRREIARQFLPDGGHVSRNPTAHIAGLRQLVDVRSALLAAGEDVPLDVVSAIDRAGPFLRMLRHGDGGLALFNGAEEEQGWLIDMLLAQADARGRPPASAPHSGYQRLIANRMVVLVDVGAPSAAALSPDAHAGPLAFEVSVGKDRLIVNCGARRGVSDAWAAVQRATAAHSTLVVDNTNAAEVVPGRGLDSRAIAVEHQRDEADGNIWLTASHNGYQARFGLAHRRRLFVAAAGDEVRGEDTLIETATGKADARGYAVRFHLHPSVQASLVQNGTAALLRSQNGTGWQLRAKGGTLSLAESIYLGGGEEMRRTEQVVISGRVASPDADDIVATVKWVLRRIPKTP